MGHLSTVDDRLIGFVKISFMCLRIRLVDQDQEQGTNNSGPGELLGNAACSVQEGGSVDG